MTAFELTLLSLIHQKRKTCKRTTYDSRQRDPDVAILICFWVKYLAGAFQESFSFAKTSPWSSHWVAFKTCLWFLCCFCVSGRCVGFYRGLCQFPSIYLGVAWWEFKSLLVFVILQLQELLQSQQFPMLMQGLSWVKNCTFDNIKPLECL